jgi:DNA-binding CsgD family transcriptional regulator
VRLTRGQLAALTRIAAAQDSEGTPEDVTAEVVDALQSVIGWDGYRVFAVDPDTLGLGRLLAASAHDGPQRRRWLEFGYQREEHVPFGSFGMEARMRAGVRAITFSESLDRSFGLPTAMRNEFDPVAFRERHISHIREYHPGLTIDGNLLMSFPDGSQWVATMQAYRANGAAPMRATDVAFAQFIAPRMGEAIGAALRREQHRTDVHVVPESGASGIILLGADRRVQYASPAGQEWLEALNQHPLDVETDLPASVWTTLAGLRAGRENVVSRIALPGAHVTIEATPGGSDGSVALVVSAARAPETTAIPSHWQLTPAESRVATAVIRGSTNREAADQLSISEHTVEWHLRHIFEKVGVHSRAQLMAVNLSHG